MDFMSVDVLEKILRYQSDLMSTEIPQKNIIYRVLLIDDSFLQEYNKM